MLATYQVQVRRLLHDATAAFYSDTDLTAYINTARTQIAQQGECVRVLTVSSTVVGQEVYTFASVNPIAAATPGVSGILKVNTIAVSWGTLKPMLRMWTWNDFQAFFRSYNTLLQNWPSDCAQYGQGAFGSMYLFPRPSQVTDMEWDCLCLPLPLVDDSTPEAIPIPWTDAVQFYAAYLAVSNAQREAGADRFLKIYDMMMKTARKQAEAPFVPDSYAGW